MDFRKILKAVGLSAVLFFQLPWAWAQDAPATAARPVSPPVPTFATLWAEYERRFLIAASKSEHDVRAFMAFEPPAIAQSLLGSNWSLVREEALRRLNDLPVYSATLDGHQWGAEFNDVFESFAIARREL